MDTVGNEKSSESYLTGHVTPVDIEYLKEVAGENWLGDCALFSFKTGSLQRLSRNGSLDVSLKVLECDIFTVSPITEHLIHTGLGFVYVAVFGDPDKPALVTYPDLALNLQGPDFFAGATPQLDALLVEITKKINDPDSGGMTVYQSWVATNARISEEGVLKGQELENAVSDANFTKAIQLAFELRRPHKLYDLLAKLIPSLGKNSLQKARASSRASLSPRMGH